MISPMPTSVFHPDLIPPILSLADCSFVTRQISKTEVSGIGTVDLHCGFGDESAGGAAGAVGASVAGGAAISAEPLPPADPLDRVIVFVTAREALRLDPLPPFEPCLRLVTRSDSRWDSRTTVVSAMESYPHARIIAAARHATSLIILKFPLLNVLRDLLE